jgi:GNAT superfamily N-acetyltransferase
MTAYQFSDALGCSFDELAELHNGSFAGYFFPMTMTSHMTADFWRVHQIDATRCVVMRDASGGFAGMARMGTRGDRGWCGGFGIVPEHRGAGAGRLLAAAMVRVARESGLATLQLEVLTQNARAIRLYEGAGFVTRRRLFGIELATEALPADPQGAELAAATEPVPVETLLPWLLSQPAERQSWGREPASLLTMRCEGLALRQGDEYICGLIVQRGGEKLRIQAAFFPPSLSDATVAGLLRQAAGSASGIQVFNEPEGSDFLARCRRLGFDEFFSQHEMWLTL